LGSSSLFLDHWLQISILNHFSSVTLLFFFCFSLELEDKPQLFKPNPLMADINSIYYGHAGAARDFYRINPQSLLWREG